MMKNTNIQYSTAMMNYSKFSWKKIFKKLLIVSLIVLSVCYPYEIGNFFGIWLNHLVEGFKNSFKQI
jgi:hypothetical protein